MKKEKKSELIANPSYNIVNTTQKNDSYLSEILPENDFQFLSSIKKDIKENWAKKQIFRTETEMRFSVLDDGRHPTKASKYWQAVREQGVHFEGLMQSSFSARRTEIQLRMLEEDIEKEKEPLKKELLQIEYEQILYHQAQEILTIKDRMREIKTWDKIIKEIDDGSFDNQNVNTHQFLTYKKIMENKVQSVGPASPPTSVFNIASQAHTLNRLSKDEKFLNMLDKNERLKLEKLEKEEQMKLSEKSE
jgi:hypothetical protein